MQQAEVLTYDRLLASIERTLSQRLSGAIIDETQDALREVSSDDLDTAALNEALEVANLTGMNDAKTLVAVRSARQKIRNGVFGICAESLANGKAHVIPQKRLKVIPYAENCVDCQTKVEQKEPKLVPLPTDWTTR